VSVTLGGDGGSGATATNAGKSLIGVTPLQFPTDFLGVRWKFETATPLTVDAPRFHVENIGFFVEDGTYAINLRCNGVTRTQEGTTGFSIYNCAIKGDAKFYANGGNELEIIKVRFQCKYDGTTGGIQLVGSANAIARPVIIGCDFIGGNGTVMATAPIVLAGSLYDLEMIDCYFGAAPTAGQYFTTSGTMNGAVSNCFFATTDAKTALSSLTTHASGLYAAGLHDENGEIDMS